MLVLVWLSQPKLLPLAEMTLEKAFLTVFRNARPAVLHICTTMNAELAANL
jgi:hypothetical protein